MFTLPSPRLDYYSRKSYQAMQNAILKETDGLAKALGFYQFNQRQDLLEKMYTTAASILFIGLIFDILLIMFVVVAVLLIYSLLMISVETKTHEIGIMRLVGLSKRGFVGMIFTQAACFVLPSIVSGFALCLPCIWIIYKQLFNDDIGYMPSIMPGEGAVL